MKCVIKQTREIITVDSGEDNEAVNAESIQEVFDIIGLPATLERTLVALGDRYIYKECSLVAMIVYDEPIE
jgi:hypothetical protein